MRTHLAFGHCPPNSACWSPSSVLVAILTFTMVLTVTGASDDTATTSPPPTKEAPLPRNDANGNPLRRAPTGHVSNYDEAIVGNYSLPDPLVLNNGESVRDAATWFSQRRPEILKAYEQEIYGRVPSTAPTLTFSVVETLTNVLNGQATYRLLQGQLGDNSSDPVVNVLTYTPTDAKAPVPLLLHLTFFTTPPPEGAIIGSTNAPPRFNEAGPIAEILARGHGYATVRYTQFEGDSATTSLNIVRKLALAPGQTAPAQDEWGTISAWAWGASRVLDYFESDPAVDVKRVALIGHSRLGKTTLWAGARDPRFALMFSSCSGEMGAALARRDYGETVDDMAANFPWQFAGNFQKYSGHWNDMPVDAHMLIALNAPRPVFITGGTEDQWADPTGMFLAAVAGGPVYRLLGMKDLGVTTDEPPLDTPLITGNLGFHYHTGGHSITEADWKAFLDFADRHLKPGPQP